MRDPFRWSISLGRWGVVTVRLHVFFLVFAAATYFLCWQDTGGDKAELAGTATLAMGVLLLSVLLHEWSHWLVARRYAVALDPLIIGPLGGVSEWPNSKASVGGLASLLAGPAANLLVCVICALTLRATGHGAELIHLVNPLVPAWTDTATPLAQQGLQLTLWINWMLFLANLLPAFPFDGGRILRTAVGLARPGWQPRRIADIVFWSAVVLSTLIMVAALVLINPSESAVFPPSFALLLLAVVLLVSARRDADNSGSAAAGTVYDTELEEPWPPGSEADELEEDDYAEEDLDDRADPDDEYSDDNVSPDEQWLPTPVLEDHGPAPEEIEAEEERMVDAILSRLHTGGLESLSPAERELLERVSARYRSRLGRRS